MIKRTITIIAAILIIIGTIQIFFYNEVIPSSNYITLSEGNLAYDLHGSGENVMIMVHGSPGSKEDFRLLAPQINGYTIYAIDMYGFGESDKKVKDYGTEAAAKTIAEFMDKKRINKAVVLGYSWGGGVVADFAYLYPEKTDKMILLSGMAIQEGEITRSYFFEHLRYLVAYPFVVYYPTAFLVSSNDGILGSMSSTHGRKGFIRSFIDTDQRTFREKLKKIESETLILHGDSDTDIKPWVAEEHHNLIPNSDLKFFKGGHGKIFSETSEMSEIINSYLENEQ